jgi:hypothetical protein
MANRYLIESPIQIRNSNEVLTYTVNITANSLKLKIEHNDPTSQFDGDKIYTLVDWELSLEILKSSQVLKSNSLMAISIPDVAVNMVQPMAGVRQIKQNNLKNISLFSKLTKSQNAFSGQSTHIPTYLSIFVKDVDGDFTDHDILIHVPSKEHNFDSNVTFSNVPDNFSHVSLLDDITVTKDASYNNDLYTKYNITTSSHVNEVYVEPVVGIVDKTRVEIDSQGNGSLRVLKSSLDGQSPRIKLGFYSYSGIAEITS